MPSRYDSVRSIFEEAQRGFQHHRKLLTELKKLHDKSSEDEFQESFLWHLKHAMVVFNREPAVERVIEFAAKYATLKDHCIPHVQKVIEFHSVSYSRSVYRYFDVKNAHALTINQTAFAKHEAQN